MADASGWWARRLGSAPPAAQPPVPSPATRYAPAPAAPAPQGLPQQQPLHTYDANGAQVEDDGFMSAITNAAQATGGSQTVKENSGKCPGCGSGNYFARKFTEQGMPLRMEAAPRCYDCGYPVVQAGSARGGANTAARAGKAQRARQLPPGHAVTIMDGSRPYTYQPRE